MTEIKTPVGKTKNDIWTAYKDVINELKELRAGKTETIIESTNKQMIKKAVDTAENQDKSKLESMLESLIKLTEEYNDVCFAIKQKKIELKDVHDIAVEADTYVALIQAKEKIKNDKEAEALKIIEEAQIKAKEIVNNANDKEQEIAKQIQESIDKFNKESKRQKEEFNYSFARNKKEQEDKLTDELAIKNKALDERENSIKEKEKDQKNIDDMIKTFENELNDVKVNKDNEIKRQVAIIEHRLKKEKEYEINTLTTEYDAKIAIKDNENNMLKTQIDDLKSQVHQLQLSIESASEKVTDIATASLNARANESKVDAVMEAVGKVGQQSNKR